MIDPRLVQIAPEIIWAFYPGNNCIATARVLKAVLKQVYGIEATPQPVEVDARSPERWVYIGPESTGNDWSGHLVLLAGGGVLDLSIQQVNRPGLTATPHWTAGELPLTVQQPSAVLDYRAIDDDTYRLSPNWSGVEPRRVEAIRALVSALA